MTPAEARTALNVGADIISVLRRVWHLLEGANAHAMTSDKLERIEGQKWSDPIVTFRIERHGSPATQIQRWKINLADATAVCTSEKPLHPRTPRPRLDEYEVAQELARSIRAGADDPRLV